MESVLTDTLWYGTPPPPAARRQPAAAPAEPRQQVTMKPVTVRNYSAAKVDRLTANWNGSRQSADSTIRFALETLRSRSRDLAENNDYVAGYLELLGNKIIGSTGIALQVKATGGDGKLDRAANSAIEKAFSAWSKRGVCDVTGRMSFTELQRLCLESMARDGEIFIRIIKAHGLNKFNFALQTIEADQVDINKNDQLANGNLIRMGVELNQYSRPVAYHVFTSHPGDFAVSSHRRDTVRIPADEMIHLFRQHRPGQTRGVPWTSAVMTRLHHLGAYEDAAITNARYGASKMGFFTRSQEAADWTGGKNDRGDFIEEVEPGGMQILPTGYEFKAFDPSYPTNEYDAFVKRQLKGASSGLPGATYADMSNDLESVNFSSIRQGTLNARDSYRSIQQLLIDVLCEPVYAEWLGQALDFGQITITSTKRGPNVRLSPAQFDKYNAPRFVARGWDWVDPLKDQMANTEALANRLTTRTRIAAESGNDFETILAETAQELQLATEYGISLEQPEIPQPLPEEVP